MNDALLFKPEYTIDTSCLIAMFGDTSMLSKTIIPGLWDNIRTMIDSGTIISHIEVLKEIKPGVELYDWARATSATFQPYDLPAEGLVIRAMSAKHKSFVNAKVKDVHADPWLIAQAKCRGLTLLTEEKLSLSSDPAKYKIPNVCDDPAFAVPHLSLFELIRQRSWSFS